MPAEACIVPFGKCLPQVLGFPRLSFPQLSACVRGVLSAGNKSVTDGLGPKSPVKHNFTCIHHRPTLASSVPVWLFAMARSFKIGSIHRVSWWVLTWQPARWLMLTRAGCRGVAEPRTRGGHKPPPPWDLVPALKSLRPLIGARAPSRDTE